MYLYKQKLKDGDIYLAIKEKYHIPGKGTRERTITIDSTETMDIGTDDTRNVGYGVIKELYKQLELDVSITVRHGNIEMFASVIDKFIKSNIINS